MNIIIICVFIFALSIIILSFFNFKLSISIYISYLILVPYLEFNFAGLSLSYNFVNTFLFVVFLFQFRLKEKNKLDFKIITPFLFLFISLLGVTLFAFETPINFELKVWRISFMHTCFISIIVWNLTLVDQKALIYFKWSLIISVTIAGIYGFYLTKLGGLNPYTTLITHYFNIKDATDIYSLSDSRLSFSTAGKIQSTMNHPMRWSLFLCFSFIFFSTFYLKTKNKIYWLIFGVIVINILISGVRTGIAALTIGVVYFLIRLRNFKMITVVLILLTIMSLFIQSNDDLSNLFSSFVDTSGTKSDIQGSSIQMRLSQFRGVLDEIKGHELCGKGYGWSDYYLQNHEIHPVILFFESLIFVVLCNSGIIGILIWIIFFYLIFKLQRKILKSKEDIFLMDTFVVVFIAYVIGTGEYGYTQLFGLYYTFLISYLFNNQQINKTIQKRLLLKNHLMSITKKKN